MDDDSAKGTRCGAYSEAICLLRVYILVAKDVSMSSNAIVGLQYLPPPILGLISGPEKPYKCWNPISRIRAAQKILSLT